MANEFKHKVVGGELSQDEWEGKDTHEADSQVADDMLYFNGTYWIRATPAQIRALLNVADGADVTADNAPKAHKASHQNDGADEVSVAGLSGLLADDQHVIDAEAKAAAVLAGAITDAETKAPTHDAVYNVKVTADTATTPGEVDTKIATHTDDVDAHHSNVADLTFIIDGGGSAITVGEKGHLEIPFACTIKRVTMLADQSGSIVVDIWKDTYAAFPPADGDSITSGAVPTISGAQKSQDATLTGWTTAIAAGDILAFNVDSAATITRVTISLKVEKS